MKANQKNKTITFAKIFQILYRDNNYMKFLIAATLIWAFSFSLIAEYLAGQVDVYFAVWIRTMIASLVFLPFIKWSILKSHKSFSIKIIAIGGIQLGLMYLFFYQSFFFLTVPEVLLFTVLTPIYVTFFGDIFYNKFRLIFLVSAIFAVAGAVIIRYENLSTDFINGFLFVQGANICFAFGQVAYKRILNQSFDSYDRSKLPFSQLEIFGLFFIGALVVSTFSYVVFGTKIKPTDSTQWIVLIWLGAIASGLGYFLWNRGATLVSTGSLAAMNNALIPAGLLVNILIWNRDVDISRLCIGAFVIIIAVLISEKSHLLTT